LMGHEELAGSFASVLREGRLMHSHWNGQPLGNYDQDLNIGVLGYDQMLATLLVFKMHSFDGYYGIDIPREDASGAGAGAVHEQPGRRYGYRQRT